MVKYYEEAGKLGGLKAKMRLAVLTKLSSSQAKSEPDLPENIEKFKNAIQEIRKEFN
jgi:hypothetical protein